MSIEEMGWYAGAILAVIWGIPLFIELCADELPHHPMEDKDAGNQ